MASSSVVADSKADGKKEGGGGGEQWDLPFVRWLKDPREYSSHATIIPCILLDLLELEREGGTENERDEGRRATH